MKKLKKSIPIFSSTDSFFLAYEMVNSNNILLDDINIGDIFTNGSIKIKVLPKLVDIVITLATQKNNQVNEVILNSKNITFLNSLMFSMKRIYLKEDFFN